MAKKDILERLREYHVQKIYGEAADEIERLRRIVGPPEGVCEVDLSRAPILMGLLANLKR